MKKTTGPILLLAGLGFMQCSTKKDDAAPVSPIPANTASILIDGKAFPIDIRSSQVSVYANSGELRASFNTTDPLGPFVLLRVAEFRNRAEQIQFTTGSSSEILAGSGFQPGAGSDYSTSFCGSRTQAVEIVTFNPTNKTVSVRFSGTACGGPNSTQQKVISEGLFNLPYTVR